MAKFRWTGQQMDLVLKRALDLYNNDEHVKTPGQAMARGQEILPSEFRMRRSTVLNPGNWAQPLFVAAVRIGLVPTTHVRVDRLMDAWPDLRAEVSKQATVEALRSAQGPKPSIDDVLRAMFEEFEGRLVKSIVSKVVAEVLHYVSVSGMPAQATEPRELHIPIQRPVKFVVCGLLPQQEHMVACAVRAWPNLQVQFAGKDDAQKSIVQRVKSTDCAFLMAKFISHSTQAAVRKAAANRVVLCNGGVSDLTRLITAKYEELRP